MVVRELISRFGFKTDKKQFQQAESDFSKLKKVATALVTVLVAGKLAGAIRNIATKTAALGDRIGKVSEKLGVNAQALQELRFAAKQTGVAQRTLDMAMQRFARRSAEAARGSGEAKDALAELGVKLKDSTGKLRPVEALLGDVAEGLRKTKGDGDRLRLAFKLFDSEGAALVTTLKGGRQALEDLRRKARETGGILDDELIAASEEYTDVQHELSLVVRGFKNLLSKHLLPVLTKSAKGVIDWLHANREIIRQNIGKFITKMVAGVRRLTEFVWRMTTATYDWSKSLDPLSSKILRASVALGVLAVALTIPGASMILFAFLIALIADDILLWWKHGKKADTIMGDLDESLGGVLGVIREILLEKGDLGIMSTAFEAWEKAAKSLVNHIKNLGKGLAGLDPGLFARWLITGRTPEQEKARKRRAKRGKLEAELEEADEAGRAAYATATPEEREALAARFQRAQAAVSGHRAAGGQGQVVAPSPGAGATISAPVTIGELNVQAATGETVTEQTKRAAEEAASEVFDTKLRQANRASTGRGG